MIELKGLTRDYGAFRALNSLDMIIGDGELHGFVGPNGAGKTTTMRILATLLPMSGGTAVVDGVDLRKRPRAVRKVVGFMPDFFGVYDRLKAWEYLDFYARCYAMNARERARMIDQLLDLVNLSKWKETYVDVLSRGMKQRLCLAHALIHDPKFLILDEPASGMDPRARAEMKEILLRLRELGKSVLISSHILPELSEMCDALTIIDRGKLVFSGDVGALAKRMQGEAPLQIRLSKDAGEGALDEAVSLLSEFPGVTAIEALEDNVLKIELPQDDQKVSALVRRMVERGIPIVDVHRHKMNLEHVFLEVTQG